LKHSRNSKVDPSIHSKNSTGNESERRATVIFSSGTNLVTFSSRAMAKNFRRIPMSDMGKTIIMRVCTVLWLGILVH